MGLDMYLNGHKYLWTDWNEPKNNPVEDGFEVREKILRLGYWRKHPDLHGYIVKTFANGVDEWQDIGLSDNNLTQILEAVKDDKLPTTTGFFFGQSTPEDKEPTIEILEKALSWLRTKQDKVSKYVVYKASW